MQYMGNLQSDREKTVYKFLFIYLALYGCFSFPLKLGKEPGCRETKQKSPY